MESRVGVVMITHNRRDEALAAVQRLCALPERPPVVVVDNGSSDGTAAAVRAAFDDVTVLALPDNRGAAGRTPGVRALGTPYVAFADDDTWWEPGALTRAADLLAAHPQLAVVNARIVVEPGGHPDPICDELADSPLPRPAWLPGPALGSFLAGASVVRREPFLAAGGFEPRFLIGGEEELLATHLLEAGHWLAYVEELSVHHCASRTRDPHLRRRQGIRNTLWFTWLRRPLPAALRRTVRLLPTLPRDRVTAAALVEAVAGLGWVLRARAPVPPEVEAQLRLLEQAQLRSRARRYVS